MHRAAFSLAVAGFPAVYLRHHTVEVSALGDTVPVTTVITDYTVLQPEISANAGGDCFLTDVGVYYTRDGPAVIVYHHSFFKATDCQHHAIQIYEGLFILFHAIFPFPEHNVQNSLH